VGLDVHKIPQAVLAQPAMTDGICKCVARSQTVSVPRYRIFTYIINCTYFCVNDITNPLFSENHSVSRDSINGSGYILQTGHVALQKQTAGNSQRVLFPAAVL